jgi:amino acid transporter
LTNVGSESSKQPLVYARRTSGLIRRLSAWDAMIYNVVFMAPTAVFVYGIWALLTYPGTDLPITAILGILISIPIGLFYAIYSASMPRSGGDYVWVSRVIHPAVGFSINFFFFVAILGIAGSYMPWFTQFALGPILEVGGYPDLAAVVVTPEFIFAFSVVFFIVSAVIISRGAKASHKAFWVFFVLIAIGVVAYIAALLYVGPDGFKANFNAQSGMDYDQAISIATAGGYPTGMVWSATLLGLAFTFMNFLGFNSSVYMSGEIKEVQRSQLIAIPVSVIIFGAIMWIIYAVTYYTMGAQFIGSLAFLFGTGDAAYKLAYPPFFENLFRFATSSPLVYGVALFGFAMMTLSSSMTYIFVCVRLLFAWSFDRVAPTSLSKVDSRYGSPYVALIVVSIVTVIMTAIWLWTPWTSLFAYAVFGWMIMQGIASISGMIFPWRRKDIFEASPKVVKMKVGPIPVITILGFITLLISIWIGYASVSPAMVGTINPSTMEFTVGLFILGAILYYVSSLYHRKGIPLELSFKQLPPE